MREHEVPTHVQAEDRVLLWFTFPQIVAMTAVCALSYGAYRYVAVGPSELRIGIAVLLGLMGLVAVVGKIGGRQLPLVAADLLSYRLGARLHRGPVSHLVREKTPVLARPGGGGSGPVGLMTKRARRGLRALRRRRNRERKGGRTPFRRRFWLRNRRTRMDSGSNNINARRAARNGKEKRPRFWRGFLGAVVVGLLVGTISQTVPQSVLADDHEPWMDEIDFEMPEPVEGRRLFVEGLTVRGDRAAVAVRAATQVDVKVQSFGGHDGSLLQSWSAMRLGEGQRVDYSLPLDGPMPSLTFSWADSLGQAGAVTITHERIPYPLPEIDGGLCDLRLTSLGWTPGAVNGVIESSCETRVEHPVDLQTVSGHVGVTETSLMDAVVTGITGTVAAATDTSQASVGFVANGETSFRLPIRQGKAVHPVSVDVRVEASLRIAMPPLTNLTHHEERTEYRTQTVSLYRPGTSRTVSRTVTVTNGDGTTSQHVISATLSIPGRTVQRNVTLTIVHPEHVSAEVVDRSPIRRSRDESLALASGVGSYDPYEVLALPETAPVDPPAQHTPADRAIIEWFEYLGWEWPW